MRDRRDATRVERGVGHDPTCDEDRHTWDLRGSGGYLSVQVQEADQNPQGMSEPREAKTQPPSFNNKQTKWRCNDMVYLSGSISRWYNNIVVYNISIII